MPPSRAAAQMTSTIQPHTGMTVESASVAPVAPVALVTSGQYFGPEMKPGRASEVALESKAQHPPGLMDLLASPASSQLKLVQNGPRAWQDLWQS
mmetsp:Transcript_24726/g.77020  ORF Transcript_24726/g.77020 Transcript_24726/m.77020 type:complete len:95 (-) Transcript_24726:256-540(-)